MRIHLGHHFYGAGNLGDDFMLAGFFAALRTLAPDATFSCCVPFPLEPLRGRFPQVEWLPCELAVRERAIAACDVWLGLGGSPFQHALSRWFLDHLLGDLEFCQRASKRMFFLGVGVQSPAEVASPDVQRLVAYAFRIWTRDPASAEYLASVPSIRPVVAAADLAHLLFQVSPPPAAAPGRLTVVPNFDYHGWPGQDAFLSAANAFEPCSRVWLAQESRELPGAERALHAALPVPERANWPLIVPDLPGQPMNAALARWPSGEWLVSARYHAALCCAWAGSKIVILATNEKLRAAARELSAPVVAPDCTATALSQALEAARAVPAVTLARSAALAQSACVGFVQAAAQS